MFWIIVVVAIVVAIVLICSYYVNKAVQRYLDINVRMGLYADVPYSVERNRIHLNFINVNKHPEFWEAHESSLKLEAMGTTIEGCKFFRSPDIPTGMKVAYPENLDHRQILALTAGVKYNNFKVSNDGGETFIPINSVKDVVAKKYQLREAAITGVDMEKVLKTDLKESIMNSDKFRYLKAEFGFDMLEELTTYSHINEGKSTSTSLRYQALLPSSHETYEAFVKNFDNIRFYYVVDGKAHQFEIEHVNTMNDYHEWDFINLQPGSIYAGIAYSLDNGKTIHASSCLSGITKDDEGNKVQFDDATLPKVDSSNGCQMYKYEDTIKSCGEAVAKANYNMLVKKHYEKDNEDSYVPLKIADQYYSEYDWVIN